MEALRECHELTRGRNITNDKIIDEPGENDHVKDPLAEGSALAGATENEGQLGVLIRFM